MNEQDVIVPAVVVPYSPAKSAKKSTSQVLVSAGSAIGIAIAALIGDPDFFAKALELAGDNKAWIAALSAAQFIIGFWRDRRKHKNAPNLVEVKDAQ